MVFPVVGGREEQGYEISNSLRFDGSSSYLHHTHESGNKDTFTWSSWIKFGDLNNDSSADVLFSATDSSYVIIRFEDKQLDYLDYDGSDVGEVSTNRLFRDVSAWYHIVVAIDMTQSTDSNRVKLYVNGVQETSFATATYQPQNQDTIVNTACEHRIGRESGNYFSGYMADINFIDGTAYAASDFGETNDNGVWIPKKPDVTYGTNGYFLEFKQTGTSANASGIGADTSGQGNHHSVSGLAATDVTTDTPTNNFATWNPLVVRGGSDDLVYTEGNTGVSSNQHATNNYTFGTQGFANGKWYWEVECETVGGEMHVGIVDSGSSTTGYPSTVRDYRNNGNKELDGGSATSFGNTYTDGDIIGVAVDLDNTSIYYSKNGTWQNSGDPESGSSKTGAAYTDISSTNFPNFVLPWVAGAGVNGGADVKAFANFGNAPFSISSGNADANGYGNFEYAVPSGYYALCTKNLAKYG